MLHAWFKLFRGALRGRWSDFSQSTNAAGEMPALKLYSERRSGERSQPITPQGYGGGLVGGAGMGLGGTSLPM